MPDCYSECSTRRRQHPALAVESALAARLASPLSKQRMLILPDIERLVSSDELGLIEDLAT